MEFSQKSRVNTLMLAVLTLFVIGFSLVLSTWQLLRQQEESSIEHMAMSARSISQAVESSFRRGWSSGLLEDEFWPRIDDFFSDMKSSGELLFIEVFDRNGMRVMASRAKGNATLSLGPAQKKILEGKGEWYGIAEYGQTGIFIYARKLRPAQGKERMLMEEPHTYMVVGLSMEKYKSLYGRFRHNAFLQTLYILAAALFVWGMSVNLISRRALAGKARFLERFQAKLLDNMPDGLLTLGRDHHVQSANAAAHDIFGFEPGTMVGKYLSELPEDLSKVLGETESSEGVLGWRQFEIQGKELEMLSTAFKGEHDDPVILILIRNRTRVRNLERRLAEAEKLAAVGTLAAGVAHEIRNPLSALRGFAQYFSKKLQGRQPDEEYANTMVREADRLNRVITDLLYLSRNKQLRYSVVDLPSAVEDVRKLLRFDLEGKRTELHVELDFEDLRADEDSVKQTLLNLVLNSLDAIGEREKAAQDENPDAERFAGRIVVRSYESDQWDVLEVEDNGHGMNEEQKKQAFEAFFTSKAKGTGLGLALVQKAVLEHGGKTELESAPGKGCVVRLYFPREAESPDSETGAIG